MNRPLEVLIRYMKRRRLDALFFNSSEHLASPNLNYITGFSGSEAAVMITNREQHLFTDGRYKIQAREEAAGYKIHVSKDKIESIARFVLKRRLFRIAIEPSRVTHEVITRLRKKVSGLIVHEIDKKFLGHFRIRKSAKEVNYIRNAATIASEACRKILEQGLIGKTELQIAGELELTFRTMGADGPSFNTIVASGGRSALPHAAPTKKEILPGELVILDFGSRISGYNSDETVTCIAGGKPSSLQKKMHGAVRDAHLRAIDSLRQGVAVREIDRVARQYISDAGFGKNFVHALGHGVGLEVHEPPWLSPLGKDVLDVGMILTIEPGVYIEGVGGVRLESLVHLTEEGPEILSCMSKELISVS